MSQFPAALASMLAKEATAAKDDPDRMGEMVEAIARGLGFTVAILARGNPAMIDEVMTGADAHAHAEAVDKAPIIRLMAIARNMRKP